eukprot:scaffold764_cov408-Prasinococcus_capsulatus_cf.AAC.14
MNNPEQGLMTSGTLKPQLAAARGGVQGRGPALVVTRDATRYIYRLAPFRYMYASCRVHPSRHSQWSA